MLHSIRWRMVISICLLSILITLGTGVLVSYILGQYYQQNPYFDLARIQREILGITLLMCLIGIGAVIVITHHLFRPIRELTEVINKLAQGTSLDGQSFQPEDEITQSRRVLHLMAEKIEGQKRELAQERAYLTGILKEMSDGVVMIDKDGRITTVNEAVLNILALKPEKMIGRTLAEGLRNHQLVELWQRSLETNLPQVSLIEIPSKQLYLQCVATPLDRPLQGNTLLFLQNLTHQRYLETMRRDFISNISHELRTPLASLKALTETLQDGALEDTSAARRFLQLIQAEVDALSQMVTELLELSRLESGRIPLKMQSINPKEILMRAWDRLQLQAERAGLKIDFDVPNDLPQIMADAERLEQVVVNLLHNAIKFTPSGGQITIGARQSRLSELEIPSVQPKAENQNSGTLFFVKDTGQGIAAPELTRIFERFYKIDRARSGSGTGLGLAIARHTVEAHGGKIWAESIEGKGSTFYFFIPAA